MPPRALSPITRRILLVFLLGSGVLFTIAGSVRLWLDYRDRTESYRLRLEETLSLLAAPAAHALADGDLRQLHAGLDPVIGLSGVLRVDVLDGRRQVVASRGQAGAVTGAEDLLVRTLPRHGSAAAGTLRLYISYAPIRARFVERGLPLLLVDICGIAALALLLFYMLQRHVVAHLQALADAVEKLDPQSRTPPMVALRRRSHEPDELDQLAEAFNRFAGDLVHVQTERRRIGQQSRHLDHELARIARAATVQALTTQIARELDRPLGEILERADTIEQALRERGPTKATVRRMLAEIATAARSANDIVDDLHTLIAQRGLDVVPLALNPLVQQVVELAQAEVPAHGARLHLQLAEGLPSVLGSALQLQQVIFDLIDNARDAITRAGQADGHIAVVTRREDPSWLRVAVIDNGTGVQPALADHVFSAFFTTKQNGSGMGLWIARLIVEQHGGELQFENVPGGGACFSFSLPVLAS